MSVALPVSLSEVRDAWAQHPDAELLAGGTDFMVEVNAGHRRPPAVIALRRVAALRRWHATDDAIAIGAGVTFADLAREPFTELVPALAYAARTVGSPQIRNAATLGGNLGTASPAGDSLPVLGALDAVVVLDGPDGERRLPIAEFLTGPKQTALAAHEIVTAVIVPPARGPQEFLKVGTRNAMVIATASVALVVDRQARTVRVGLGSVGPTVLRAPEAELHAETAIDWDDAAPVDPTIAAEFGAFVAEAARPIDDHRSTADYRRHAVAVLARRALTRVCARA